MGLNSSRNTHYSMNSVYGFGNILSKEIEDYLISNVCEKTDLPIYVRHPAYEPHIFVQIEPLGENPDLQKWIENPNIIEIWDYCENNVEILKSIGISNVKKLNFDIWDTYRDKLISYNTDNIFDYDIVFVGWVNSRREKILKELISSGLNVKIIGYNQELYGDERDKIIAKSEILLNIHYHENSKCFEWFRCYPWLPIGKKVVSEISNCDDERVNFVEYDKIVKYISDYFEFKNTYEN